MGNIARRLENLEKLVAAAACVCDAPEHQIKGIPYTVGRSETAEDLRLATEATRFICPVHGERYPKSLFWRIRGL